MSELELAPVRLDLAEPPPVRPRPENPYWVYLARFTGEAERSMRRCLDRIAAMIMRIEPVSDPPRDLGEQVPWETLRYPYVVLLRTKLIERWDAPSTVNKHLSAIRGVLEEAWKLGLMPAEEYQRAISIKQAKGSRELVGRNIHDDETIALLRCCAADDNTVLGIRDAAIIAVLQSTGIRRAEVASALIERYDPGDRALRVIGKGNKERTVYLHRAAISYLDRWLVASGARRGHMFRVIDRLGRIRNRPLATRTVGYIVNKRREQAGLPPLSTHDFRRTFIGDFIDAGGDLVQAQKLAGHASATTTAAYDRRPGRALRAAVDRLSLPSPDELGTGAG